VAWTTLLLLQAGGEDPVAAEGHRQVAEVEELAAAHRLVVAVVVQAAVVRP
jgi:hypothetical protein